MNTVAGFVKSGIIEEIQERPSTSRGSQTNSFLICFYFNGHIVLYVHAPD